MTDDMFEKRMEAARGRLREARSARNEALKLAAKLSNQVGYWEQKLVDIAREHERLYPS